MEVLPKPVKQRLWRTFVRYSYLPADRDVQTRRIDSSGFMLSLNELTRCGLCWSLPKADVELLWLGAVKRAEPTALSSDTQQRPPPPRGKHVPWTAFLSIVTEYAMVALDEIPENLLTLSPSESPARREGKQQAFSPRSSARRQRARSVASPSSNERERQRSPRGAVGASPGRSSGSGSIEEAPLPPSSIPKPRSLQALPDFSQPTPSAAAGYHLPPTLHALTAPANSHGPFLVDLSHAKPAERMADRMPGRGVAAHTDRLSELPAPTAAATSHHPAVRLTPAEPAHVSRALLMDTTATSHSSSAYATHTRGPAAGAAMMPTRGPAAPANVKGASAVHDDVAAPHQSSPPRRATRSPVASKTPPASARAAGRLPSSATDSVAPPRRLTEARAKPPASSQPPQQLVEPRRDTTAPSMVDHSARHAEVCPPGRRADAALLDAHQPTATAPRVDAPSGAVAAASSLKSSGRQRSASPPTTPMWWTRKERPAAPNVQQPVKSLASPASPAVSVPAPISRPPPPVTEAAKPIVAPPVARPPMAVRRGPSSSLDRAEDGMSSGLPTRPETPMGYEIRAATTRDAAPSVLSSNTSGWGSRPTSGSSTATGCRPPPPRTRSMRRAVSPVTPATRPLPASGVHVIGLTSPPPVFVPGASTTPRPSRVRVLHTPRSRPNGPVTRNVHV
jgi:hypothetical protein